MSYSVPTGEMNSTKLKMIGFNGFCSPYVPLKIDYVLRGIFLIKNFKELRPRRNRSLFQTIRKDYNMTKLSEKLQDYQLALGLTVAGIFSVLVVYAPLYLSVFFFTKSFNMFLPLVALFMLYSIIVLPIVAVIALKILEKD